MLHKEFKYVFTWTYKDLKGIPPQLVQHTIELDISIPLAHQTMYILKPTHISPKKEKTTKNYDNQNNIFDV